MDGNDSHWWDDDRLMALLRAVLGDQEADRAGNPALAAPDDQPAGISLADVVAAGRAAFCWLDVVVTLRNVDRHQEPVMRASTALDSGH